MLTISQLTVESNVAVPVIVSPQIDAENETKSKCETSQS
jgi:hypothetical protein